MDEKKSQVDELAAPRAVWEAPTIEEIDYAQTEAAYGPPGGADAGIYTF